MRFYGIVQIKVGYLAVIAAAFVLTILVQMMIFVVAREQDKRIQQLHRSLEHNHPHNGGEGSVVQSHSSQTSNKAAKTIGFLLVVYIASWLPVNIYRQEYRWNGGDPILYHKWVKIINLLIQLHSCINPYVFVLRSKDMKSAIAKLLRALGVRQCLCGERDSQIIVGSNGNTLTASSHARSSNVNIYEISDQRNGDTAGSCEDIELGHMNTSYRNSCGNNANENTTDRPDNGQSGNIQGVHSSDNKNITLENVGRKRDERNMVNSLKTACNVNFSKEERMVSDVGGNIENEENMESTDIRENGNGISMLESQSVDINTRDNDSRGEGMANSENDKNTQYVKKDKSSSDNKKPGRSPDQN
ncbi:---NA--- [Paramuricea clavata]|uniref:---NA n=1 Tax=Paramuricea clavata TaxID=317549 RepID=A0A7D9DC50_PARCT|nr:---NA--- [Paramuricea clavata]